MFLRNAALPTLCLLLPAAVCVPLETAQAPLLAEEQQGVGPTYQIPTRYQSTVLARRLLALSSFGVVSTIFPSEQDQGQEQGQEQSLSSLPIALPEYLSDCESPSTGNPTLLMLNPSTTTRNLRGQKPGHQNLSLSIAWWDQQQEHQNSADLSPFPELSSSSSSSLPPTPPRNYSSSALSQPRLSLLGYLEHIPTATAQSDGIVSCYLRSHPDAGWWLPDDPGAAHPGFWARMVVQRVYWLGGFGDRAYLGWLDMDEWRRVGEAEWRAVRLPGEQVKM